MIERSLVVIGGGSAGMEAAIHAYKLGVRDILIIEKNNYLGGILDQCIHNGFGLGEFKEELTGPEFMSRLSEQIEQLKINYRLNSNVLNISKDKIVTYSNKSEGIVEIKAKAIIFTTGCYERSAGSIALPGDRPVGIFTAGQAQLYLNKEGYLVGKRVFILGSGDIGLIMARRMTLEGAKVLGVAELMPYSAGLNRNITQCLKDFNIPLYLSHTVKKVIGKKRLEKVVIAPVDEHFNFIEGHDLVFDVDVLLLSVGLIPNVDLLKNLGITFTKNKGAKVNNLLETEIPGLFTAGNVLHVHDLVDDVVKEAREAALGAARYLKNELKENASQIETLAGNGIGYIVPSIIEIENVIEDVTLKFRVKKPYHDKFIYFSLNDKIIKKMFKPAIIPSEMEVVTLKKDLFINSTGSLKVYVEEK